MMDGRHNSAVQFIQVTPRSQVKQASKIKQGRSHGSSSGLKFRKEHSRFTVTHRCDATELEKRAKEQHKVESRTSIAAEFDQNILDDIEDDIEAINLTSDYDLETARCNNKPSFEERARRASTKEAFANGQAGSHDLMRLSSDESVDARVTDVNLLGKSQDATVIEIEEKDEGSSCCSKAPSSKEVWHTPPSKRKGSHSSNRRSSNESASSYMTDRSELDEAVCDDNAQALSEQDILNLFTNDRSQTELDAIEVRSQLRKFFKAQSQCEAAEDPILYNAVTDYTEEFVLVPPLIGHEVCCKITRDRKGVDRGLYPTYYLHLERPEGKKILLLAGRKRKKSTTSNYLISTDVSDLSRDSNHCVGKVRSNLLGTQFTIYGSGPSIRKCEKKRLGPVVLREELAAVVYEPNVLGFKGPRKMKVIIPEMKNEVQRQEHRPDREGDGMLEMVKRNEDSNFFELKNKAPVWNEDNQSFVLNFHGRVTQASVKNFQIIHEDRDDYVILQFGKTASETFTMDYRYPLNALQAFAIVLTSFDNKLACE